MVKGTGLTKKRCLVLSIICSAVWLVAPVYAQHIGTIQGYTGNVRSSPPSSSFSSGSSSSGAVSSPSYGSRYNDWDYDRWYNSDCCYNFSYPDNSSNSKPSQSDSPRSDYRRLPSPHK
ncbi:MAG: hypothetical protein MESAZ_00583 [Saezia sanguinis]